MPGVRFDLVGALPGLVGNGDSWGIAVRGDVAEWGSMSAARAGISKAGYSVGVGDQLCGLVVAALRVLGVSSSESAAGGVVGEGVRQGVVVHVSQCGVSGGVPLRALGAGWCVERSSGLACFPV
jgi:hypothetical protein